MTMQPLEHRLVLIVSVKMSSNCYEGLAFKQNMETENNHTLVVLVGKHPKHRNDGKIIVARYTMAARLFEKNKLHES